MSMSNTNLKYSKLNIIKNNDNNNIHKSRSLDFSDLAWFPQTPKSIKKSLHNVVKPRSTTVESSGAIQIDAIKTSTTTTAFPIPISYSTTKEDHRIDSSPMKKVDDDDDDDREGSKAVLRRNGSVSSSLSAVKSRVLSMRRSSSVNSDQRYCRIYDQSVTLDNIVDENEQQARSAPKKLKGGGKILKLCKRFFGL